MESEENMMLDLLMKRRSCRKFQEKTVEAENLGLGCVFRMQYKNEYRLHIGK